MKGVAVKMVAVKSVADEGAAKGVVVKGVAVKMDKGYKVLGCQGLKDCKWYAKAYTGVLFQRFLKLGAGTGRYKKTEGFRLKWSQIMGSQKSMKSKVEKAVAKCR